MFSKTAHYALRLMVCVARRGTADEPVRSQDLADAAAVPPAYISKVMRRLEEAGLVESRKGRGGGFWLGREPSTIGLAAVLRAVDEPALTGDECVFGWGRCNPSEPCPLHHTWSALKVDGDAWARRTLADVLEDAP